MANTYVTNYKDIRAILFPVSGAGSNIPVGTVLMRGVTAATNIGVLIPCTAASNARGIGLLAEPHIYANSGDATTAGTVAQWFAPVTGGGSSSFQNAASITGYYPSHPVDLFDTATIVKVDYDLTSTTAVASASTTALTVTGAVAGEDSSFVYVNAGTGIGQIGFIKSSTTNTLTLTSALTTTLDSSSKLTKIIRLFEDTVIWKVNSTTNPTILDSTAGVGTGRAVVLANFLQTNGIIQRFDPKLQHNMQGVNNIAQLYMYSYLGLVDSAFHPIS